MARENPKVRERRLRYPVGVGCVGSAEGRVLEGIRWKERG
jgi:hypothetical protein